MLPLLPYFPTQLPAVLSSRFMKSEAYLAGG
jgi:hypothetical protein